MMYKLEIYLAVRQESSGYILEKGYPYRQHKGQSLALVCLQDEE